jgi:tellurium resistance protein TerD
MGINLVKGQTIDLRKNESGTENDISSLTIGLGWDINDNGADYDLDACALLLNKEGKLERDSDIVSYQNKIHSSGHIYSTGDNLTGAGDGDDEQLICKLNSLDEKYDKVVFYATIYQGKSRGQDFSKVSNAFIRAVDNNGKEITKYNISGDSSMKGKRSFIFAEAYRKDGSWKFRALGESFDTDSLNQIAESYKSGSAGKKKLFGIFG